MTLCAQPAESSTGPDIAPLTAADIASLRLRPAFRLDADELAQIVTANPGASFWIPDTHELIVVGAWRNRSDIHAIHGLAAGVNEARLIAAATDYARSAGVTALVIVDAEEARRPIFYVRNQFRVIDHIATYELAPGTAPAPVRTDIDFRRITRADRELFAGVVTLDHRAFPWFWWNVAAEFDVYDALPGVEIWVGTQNGRIVSYFGITHYRTWGHLDRIATNPDLQRGGIGRATLEMAIRLLQVQGARRIALSTQGENFPAQHMYGRRGFIRTPSHDYAVYGNILHPARFGPENPAERP